MRTNSGRLRIRSQERPQAPKIRFKRVEQRERLGRIYVVEIAAERDAVTAQHLRNIIDNLVTAFFVKVRIAAIHAHGKCVRYLEVRLRAYGGKIEESVRILQAEVVDQRTGEHRGQAAD